MEGTSSGPQLGISTDELAAQITELAGHLNAANRRWLALIAEFDRRQGWSDSVTHTCAHWLNWKCGIDLGAAREKVRALTRVACEGTEAAFLSIALHGTPHHVETIVRQYRRATEAAELSREAQQQAGRKATYYWDDDGSLVLRARLPAETGVLLLRALEVAEADVPFPAQDVSAEMSPRAARRADALGVLAESFLKHGAEVLNGGERHQIVVHVDHRTLRQQAPGRCELDEGPAIPVETARRLGCDASVVTVVEDEDGEPLDVGRRTRSIPPALRRALNSRDRGCRFPGCTHTRYVDGHHIQHWAEGGETKLSNLVSLCRFHHRQVHEGRIAVQRLDDGAWRFVKPSGEIFVSSASGHTLPLDVRLPSDHAACDGTELIAAHRAQGLAIDATTAATQWRGERMDHVYAIDMLVQRAERAGTFPRKRAARCACSSQGIDTARPQDG